MTGIIVLWREAEASRCYEVTHRLLHRWPAPVLATIYYDVDINGQAIVVSTFSGRSREWTPREVTEVKRALLLYGAVTATVIELHGDAVSEAPSLALDDHRAKGIVE